MSSTLRQKTFSDERMSRIFASNRSKYSGSCFNFSSFKAKPVTRYSFNRCVAHWRNWVPRADFTR